MRLGTYTDKFGDIRWVGSGEPAPAPVRLLHIYISAARRWESHKCGSVEIRDYLRAVWRRAGCATAVDRCQCNGRAKHFTFHSAEECALTPGHAAAAVEL